MKTRENLYQASEPADVCDRLALSLFLLRVSVFFIMLLWISSKFIDPDAQIAYQDAYGSALGRFYFSVLGALELLLLVAFVSGSWKRFSYAMVTVAHAIPTMQAFPRYLDPFNHLLLLAAWPVLAACVTLYMLREFDTRFTTGWG